MSEEKKTIELNDKDLENIAGGDITFDPLRKEMVKKEITTGTAQEKDIDQRIIEMSCRTPAYIANNIDKLAEELNMKVEDLLALVMEIRKKHFNYFD